MPTLTPNFNYYELAQGDTVQDAVGYLNNNFQSLDGEVHITGFGQENGFSYLRLQATANPSEDIVVLWGTFKYADSRYNTAYAIGDGTYKSIQSNSDTTGLVTLSFPTFAAFSNDPECSIIFGGGDPDGANSPQTYAHLETEAVLLKYTESGGAKVGVSFYWTCPKQETGASVWAKKASVLIIGRL